MGSATLRFSGTFKRGLSRAVVNGSFKGLSPLKGLSPFSVVFAMDSEPDVGLPLVFLLVILSVAKDPLRVGWILTTYMRAGHESRMIMWIPRFGPPELVEGLGMTISCLLVLYIDYENPPKNVAADR